MGGNQRGVTTIVPGATKGFYTHVTAASDANTSVKWLVVVSNSYGSVTSSAATEGWLAQRCLSISAFYAIHHRVILLVRQNSPAA